MKVYKAICDTALALSRIEGFGEFNIISRDTAARILAVVYLQGGDERFTLSKKLTTDLEYIQERYQIHGAGRYDVELGMLVKRYVHDCEKILKETDEWPAWAYKLFQERYGFRIYNL